MKKELLSDQEEIEDLIRMLWLPEVSNALSEIIQKAYEEGSVICVNQNGNGER